MLKNCYVYWIHTATQTNYKTEGYVGVAFNPKKRLSRHLNEAKKHNHPNKKLSFVLLNEQYIFSIVFTGSKEECYSLEKQLRQKYNVGWNIVPGGEGGSTTLGKKMSKEFCMKRSEYMKNKIPAIHSSTGEKIGLVNKDHPNVLSGLWVHTSKNKKFAEEHKLKIKQSNLGKNKNKFWWNNGEFQKKCQESPGKGWIRGRLNYVRTK